MRWEPFDTERLTGTEQEALKLLTAAGLVELRFMLRVSLLGHPVCMEATITATGEYGLVEAVEPVASAAWQAWADEYGKRVSGTAEDRPRLHCEKTGPEQARLTNQGELALGDVRAGKGRMTLDFICRRGLPFALRPAVPGEGRAERIRTQAATPPAPLDVRLTNLPELSAPLAGIAEALDKLLEKRAAVSQSEGVGDRLAATSGSASAAQPDQNVFCLEPGGHWRIHYEGRRVGLFSAELGFRYIYELLLVGGKTVSASQVRDHCRRMPVGRPMATEAEAAEAGLAALCSGDPVVDPETIRKVRQVVDDLKAHRAATSDPEETAELGEQIQKAEAYLDGATNVSGSPRPMRGNRLKRDADAVRSRIQLAIDKIMQHDKRCGIHFLQSIRTGTNLSYTPCPEVVWALA